jgi:cell division protein FtsA
VSFKSLSHIIQARMDEIINKIVYEIENSGFLEKLGAGIALTGGGALLKNLPQLVKFRTGLDVRVANPRMFIFSDGFAEINQPMYSTSVGLILKGFEYLDANKEICVDEEISEDFLNVEPVVKTRSGSRILDLFKSNITNLFDEKDSKM